MRSCVNTIAVLVVFSCFIIPIRAETIYEDEFNGDGPLSEKDWLTNAGYTQVSGEAKPASPGNLVLVPPLPMDPNTVYIVSFKGCKLSTDKANVGDNWFGLMDVSNGWTPHRGIALRLTGDNEISIAIDLEGPGQFQSGTPMKLLAGQVYDFQFKFQPGGIVQIFGNQAGAEPNLLVQRRKAPTSPLSVSTYMDQSMLSISAVKIEKEEPMELKESAMELLAVLPKSFQAVIATKATFHMDKFPIGFWNYVELEGYPDKIDEAEVRGWADCGASVMLGPEPQEWAADHPTKVKQILQWCQQFGIKLIVSDRRAKVKIDPATQLPPADYKEQIKKVYDD